jgi:phenylacetate-CoA ligase
MRVGTFLELHPSFSFDLEEHLIATRFVPQLGARFARFCEVQEVGFSRDAAKHALVQAVRCELSTAVPAYEGYQGISTFDDIPLMGKDSIRKRPDSFTSTSMASGGLWRKDTSGTTGPPITIWYSAEFYFDVLLLTLPKITYLAQHGGRSTDDFFCIAITDNLSCTEHVVADPSGRTGLTAQVVIDESRPETVARAFHLIRELRPKCVTGKPSVFEALVADLPRSWNPQLAAVELVISSGTDLDMGLRAQIAEVLACTVANAYGLTEFGLVAAECPQSEGLHVDESSVVAEILNEAGDPVEPGVLGEVVLSRVGNAAMPLVRYRTGDLGKLLDAPCICGARSMRLAGISGRLVRSFRLPSGQLFSPAHLNDFFELFPLREFQVTQWECYRFEVLLEFHGYLSRRRRLETLHSVRDEVARRLPTRVTIEVHETVFRRDIKFERYRTLVPSVEPIHEPHTSTAVRAQTRDSAEGGTPLQRGHHT